MPKTRQITVNSVSPTAIIVQSNPCCASVKVMENMAVAGWPTTDLLIYKREDTDTPIQWPAGTWYPFEEAGAHQGYGARVGWVKTVTGSTTLDVDES